MVMRDVLLARLSCLVEHFANADLCSPSPTPHAAAAPVSFMDGPLALFAATGRVRSDVLSTSAPQIRVLCGGVAPLPSVSDERSGHRRPRSFPAGPDKV